MCAALWFATLPDLTVHSYVEVSKRSTLNYGNSEEMLADVLDMLSDESDMEVTGTSVFGVITELRAVRRHGDIAHGTLQVSV